MSETLAEWGDHRLVEEAALLVSELVTNAVVHARSAVDVVIGRQGGHAVLRVEVHDTSGAPPRLGAFGPETLSGRGLALVDALSSRWGVETAGSGKRIWFELADSPTPAGRPAGGAPQSDGEAGPLRATQSG